MSKSRTPDSNAMRENPGDATNNNLLTGIPSPRQKNFQKRSIFLLFLLVAVLMCGFITLVAMTVSMHNQMRTMEVELDRLRTTQEEFGHEIEKLVNLRIIETDDLANCSDTLYEEDQQRKLKSRSPSDSATAFKAGSSDGRDISFCTMRISASGRSNGSEIVIHGGQNLGKQVQNWEFDECRGQRSYYELRNGTHLQIKVSGWYAIFVHLTVFVTEQFEKTNVMLSDCPKLPVDASTDCRRGVLVSSSQQLKKNGDKHTLTFTMSTVQRLQANDGEFLSVTYGFSNTTELKRSRSGTYFSIVGFHE